MLNALKNLFAPKPAPRSFTAEQVHALVRQVRARYDAAATTENNRKHWHAADALSSNAANNPGIRRTLRNRARYEVANNSYARGIVLTLANDCIGTGPRLQMLAADRESNTLVERQFCAWAKRIKLAEKLRTMRMAKVQDGEVFAVLVDNQGLDSPVTLDLRLVEAEQIANPYATLPFSETDGITFDPWQNPVSYSMLKSHPGDVYVALDPGAFDIPAKSMLHYFRTDRPGQTRGIPEITPALTLFAMLRDYTLATLDAAKAAAYVAAMLKTAAPANSDIDQCDAMVNFEIERNMIMTLPQGWDMTQLKAEQPTGTYAEFKHELVNEIARCLNIPFNIAAGNSSTYNYASGRMDHQVYFKSVRVEQAHIADTILDRVFDAWIAEAVRINGYLPQSLRSLSTDWSHQWFWDGSEHVDPKKESEAQATRLQNNTTTLAHEFAKQGKDWEVELAQRAREFQRMTELGIPALWPTPAPIPTPAYDEEDEPAATPPKGKK